jgi:hypothetical protein
MAKTFKKIIFCVIFLSGFLVCQNAMAADHYVRSDATGNNDGSDWTNAFTAIPAIPTHGDTYWLASGNYGVVAIGSDYAGSDYLNIYKATSTGHGAAGDWNSSYGVGQAIFKQIWLKEPYINLDGITGSGTSGYGILVQYPCADFASDVQVALIQLSGKSVTGNHHITVKHVEVHGIDAACMQNQWNTYGWNNCSVGVELAKATSTIVNGVDIANNYIHDNSSNMVIRAWGVGDVNFTNSIHDNYFGGNVGATGGTLFFNGTTGSDTLVWAPTQGTATSSSIGKELWNTTTHTHCTITSIGTYSYICANPNGMTWTNRCVGSNCNASDGGKFEAACHGQQISGGGDSNVQLYNNTFVDSSGYVVGEHASHASNWNIYNNIIIGGLMNAAFGTSTSSETDNVWNWQVHNNTFVGCNFNFTAADINAACTGLLTPYSCCTGVGTGSCTSGGASYEGAVFPGHLTDAATNHSYAYNNLFYNCKNPRLDNGVTSGFTSGGVVHDNNAYLACTTGSGGYINSADETAPQRDDNASDPFTNRANGDYTLKAGTLPINNGKTGLDATYVLDKAGNTRDAAPDIGAYEYISGTSDTTSPAAPTGLSVD